ncbi:hypothetical protein VKT23_010524 [Stygiomarasmius scandens]|uniref:Heterokaryon incompatibility domain-containing protein n=1 Tax=Marasmiellus scandens TaxID=2682957 RepID=A0ABR1JF89_9AGAR
MAPLDIRPRCLVDTHTHQLVEFNENNPTPPYAILSHMWMKNQHGHGEEVTLPELKRLHRGSDSDETRSKSGYHKILSACNQAFRDGLDYIWIDTCCIDKRNHEDVALNIRSMYAYYQNTEICYAYLADKCVGSAERWTPGDSMWFRRGWTLQELLAPRQVIFFDQTWKRIGSKSALKDVLYQSTAIPQAILEGKRFIRNVDPLERMSWALGRETSKPQDQAYCLLGLLGVSMDPNYDEDVETSFERVWTAFVDAHPEHRGALGSVKDFYSFLHGKHWRSRYEALYFMKRRRKGMQRSESSPGGGELETSSETGLPSSWLNWDGADGGDGGE